MHLRRLHALCFGRPGRTPRAGWLWIAGSAVISLGLACSHDGNGSDAECSDEEPTFAVTVEAGDDVLPRDTVVRVRSGGTTEQHPPLGSRTMLFCTEVSPGDLDAGAELEELRCSLYTGQAAELTVQASGYPDHESTLIVERSDDGCIVTHEEQIVLLLPDAGT